METSTLSIPPEHIRIIPPGSTKEETINLLVDALKDHPAIGDLEEIRRAVFEREAVQSTGIGNGIAVPHVRLAGVSEPLLVFGLSREGVDFQALDNEPVHVVVLFVTPASQEKAYLNLMARVMLLLRNRSRFASLISCDTPEEACTILCR
ncbi:MAG TPA: PTS sugar transporter subunit IIA [Candidatus Hydrogenedentes bacterium]|nr:PTS sugar transporter subunit IIA [Candidatus Hydrogenedentota bacterium]HOJ68621.1 PTS sugar transporter subunit IIA [Candidatus Hydrogenedentota bacterium]HOK88682.1 PTS sugar transporter subunit IIA [Candidatus Hydrogenedentota bacterium]HOV60447.1 PTS sugar transporter subunit IIA [Candidatus Hydrogenedentota bacterium]